MQVYELMNILAEMPAGADVVVYGIVTTKAPGKDCDEIEDGVYCFNKNVEDIERSGEYTVNINLG